ncbi:MAG TPA: hypothetical protein VN999_09825 [Thermoanaerobaculia bacterium]|nr:hypothetical protein [Thermoanaerobaculia bacterium]
MLSIIFGYSKYYVDSLSENVRRGMRAKVERGWLPNFAPAGYLNDQETGGIIPDPERFDAIARDGSNPTACSFSSIRKRLRGSGMVHRKKNG